MSRLRTRTAGSRLAIVLTAVIVTTVVVAGGVALATVGINSVGSPQIKNGSITSADIGNGQVKTVDIANGTVNTADIRNDAIRGIDIRNGTVTTADIADQTIGHIDIQDGSVFSGEIADGTIGPVDLEFDLQPRWAKVDFDGTTATLLNGRGVLSATKFTSESVEVEFSYEVWGCGWIATRINPDGFTPVSGEIAVTRHTTDPTVLRVFLFDSAGAFENPGTPFTLQVLC